MNISSTQIIGITAGVLTSISMLPQLIKVIKEKEVKDISGLMIALLIAGLSCWVVYGILIEDIPIIATNGLSVILNAILVFYKLRYRKKK